MLHRTLELLAHSKIVQSLLKHSNTLLVPLWTLRKSAPFGKIIAFKKIFLCNLILVCSLYFFFVYIHCITIVSCSLTYFLFTYILYILSVFFVSTILYSHLKHYCRLDFSSQFSLHGYFYVTVRKGNICHTFTLNNSISCVNKQHNPRSELCLLSLFYY